MLWRKLFFPEAVILAALLLSVLFFYAEEDWRGARDWAACQQDLQAKGETLDLQQLAPRGAPENDLTRTPIFAEAFRADYATTPLSDLGIYLNKPGIDDAWPNDRHNLARGIPFDLVAWQKYYRSSPEPWMPKQAGSPAQDVLARLAHFEPEMTAIDEAVSNPKSFWPIECVLLDSVQAYYHERGFLHIITTYQEVGRVLQLQAVAHLENHEPEKAAQDFQQNQRLVQSLVRVPFLVNALVAYGVQIEGEGILWEGIRRHVWSDAQLDDMEKSMASVDFLDIYRRNLRFERALSLQCLSYLEKGEPIPVPYTPGEEYKMEAKVLLMRLSPQGQVDQAKINFCREIQKMIDAVDLNRGTLNLSLNAEDKEASLIPFLDDLQGLNGLGRKVAEAETRLRLAQVACFLESYYLKQGHYPEKLEELSGLPPHLDQEVIREQPFYYQRKGNGYLLYSVGWDGIDHGGVPTGPRIEYGYKNENADYDWIWPSP